MIILERGTIAQEGIGKPDYSKEISLGRERPGITLKYSQSLKIFGVAFSSIPSPMPTLKSALAAGAMEHLVDFETGLDMPYTIPQGYTMTALSGAMSFSQDAIVRVFYDTYMVSHLGAPAGGGVLYVAEILGWGTYLLDPLGASSHIYDVQLTNQGGDNLEGSGSVLAILEAVGTEPLPTTKTVKCKFCGHEETVPRETTEWICPNCSKLNLYYNLSRFREAP